MVGEVFAGLSAFKTMFDMAKGLKDINDAAIRNGAVIELQEQILAAQQAQTALLERIGDLEKEVASFEAWEAEKERYELKHLGYSAFAYMLKPYARSSEPPHWVCAHCYKNGHTFIIQYTVYGTTRTNARRGWFCPSCHNEIEPSTNSITWLD